MINPEQLMVRAAEFFGVEDPQDLRRRTRSPYRSKNKVSHARYALSRVLNQRFGWGQKRIARFLQKDKSSIRRALDRADELYRQDPVFHAAVREIEAEIYGDPPI